MKLWQAALITIVLFLIFFLVIFCLVIIGSALSSIFGAAGAFVIFLFALIFVVATLFIWGISN